MKIGLQIYHFDWPSSPQNISSKLIEIAQTAERVGFYSLWVMDHFFQLGGVWGSIEAPMLEGYSTMSYLAAVTQRIKVGLMVTGNFYRHPGLLIKTVTTLDVMSGGRAYLGIGTGWCEREAKGLGVPYPTTRRELVERLEETLQIAKQMWKGDISPYEGQYYQLSEPINSPQPLSHPHPPILIGCEGEMKMPQLVAKYADAVNLHLGTPLKEYPTWMRERYHNRKEDLTRKLNIIKDNCIKIGRSYDDIERTTLATVKLAPDAMTTAEVIDLCQGLADMGFHHVIFNIPNSHEITPLELLGDEVIQTVAEV
jgi:F420-dependent oxidoreductase-like protein